MFVGVELVLFFPWHAATSYCWLGTHVVHAVHTLFVVAEQDELSYSSSPHAAAQFEHTLSVVAVHAVLSYVAPVHAALHGEHTLSVVAVHAVLSKV